MKKNYYVQVSAKMRQAITLTLPFMMQPITNGENGEPKEIEVSDISSLCVRLQGVGETGQGKNIGVSGETRYEIDGSNIVLHIASLDDYGYAKAIVSGKYGQVCILAEVSLLSGTEGETSFSLPAYVFKVVDNSTAAATIQDLMGLYTDRTPLTLTPAYSGKAIVAPMGAKLGSLTDYPGASVSVEYSVTRGDMLLIKPGKTSNDYFTVAQVTEKNGVKLYEKVMSLNELAEVPTDGYLRFLVMPSDMVIVVTFFAQEAAFDETIRVMRCGAFANISTQVGNIYADLKARVGELRNLNTQAKGSLVDAINEVYAYAYTDKGMVYGVRHMYEDASCGLIRIGNEDLHATLPVQNLIRRCVMTDDGEVSYYLDSHDSTKKQDGTPANLDGTDGQVMVEIPEHYRRFTDNTELKAYDCEISLLPFDGAHKVNKCYISAYQATIHRPTNKLSSVASMAPEYRGGNNSAQYDGTYRTMLGRPASGTVSLTSARNSAHNRGEGWEQMMYDVYVALYWLYVVEYANLNPQLAFNSDRTDRGYRQGGIGDGVTTVNSTQWDEKFGYYGFVPCGITNELGNQTGVVLYDVPDAEEDSVWCQVSVHSYRGVENPFGHIWHLCDGFLAVGNGTQQEYFICHDRKKFASTKNDGYESIGMSAGANGYMKTMLRTELGDILAASIGGGTTIWFADYHYEAFGGGTTYGLLLGGSAHTGAYAGFVCGNSVNGSSSTLAYIGSRLCYFLGTSVIDF